MPHPALARRLKQAREKHYESANRAAEGDAALARQICRYESGEQVPSATILAVLCTRYGCSADWLLGLSSRRRTG